MLCSVFVSELSPSANVHIGVVANTPAIKEAANTAAIVNILLFILHMPIKLGI